MGKLLFPHFRVTILKLENMKLHFELLTPTMRKENLDLLYDIASYTASFLSSLTFYFGRPEIKFESVVTLVDLSFRFTRDCNIAYYIDIYILM